MWYKLCLVALFLTGLAWADDKADYERTQVEIQQMTRNLGQLQANKSYKEALRLQVQIADLSQKALDIALSSAELSNAKAWQYHAKTLKNVGHTEAALKALDNYFKTPLLDRNAQRDGWKKRAEIYARARDDKRALKAYEKALSLADDPRDAFALRRDIASRQIRMSEPDEALKQAQKMELLIDKMEASQRLRAQRNLQSLLVRIYRELGDATATRLAKFRELELRREMLQEEIDHFDQRYPDDQQ